MWKFYGVIWFMNSEINAPMKNLDDTTLSKRLLSRQKSHLHGWRTYWWTNGPTNGQTDGQTDGQMDRPEYQWTKEGPKDSIFHVHTLSELIHRDWNVLFANTAEPAYSYINFKRFSSIVDLFPLLLFLYFVNPLVIDFSCKRQYSLFSWSQLQASCTVYLYSVRLMNVNLKCLISG